jgi:hypothetical protein
MQRHVWEWFENSWFISPLLLNVALEYTVLDIHVNLEYLEMTHQILISVENIKFRGRNICKIFYKEEHKIFIGYYVVVKIFG